MPLFSKKKEKKSNEPLTVALIGCGPSGMSLLHALSQYKNKSGVDASTLPIITCYERAPCAGGLWRDLPQDDLKRENAANKALMYDDLWCNIPKELMEYYDYTFYEHFKKETPTYLPRKDILEYITARNSKDGALDNVKFNHVVKSVSFQNDKFQVTVEHNGSSSTSTFDKCIWAGGINGFLEDPEEIDEFLEEFTGEVLHSSESVEDFEKYAKNKTIMMIGDNASAEDLTLRALKLGAKKVYICARSGQGVASDTASWPKGKVEMVWGLPYKLVKGNGFKCQGVYWSEKRQKFRKDDEEPTIKIKDIDTVIECTGYNANLDFMDVSLRLDQDKTWELPKNWEMVNNAFTITLGNVSPSKSLMTGATVYPQLYKGLWISNPNMMYLMEYDDSEMNLLEIDVNAWIIVGYLTGQIDVPKEKDMLKANDKQLNKEMQIPWIRSGIDREYLAELNDLDDNHWSENAQDERCIVLEKQVHEFKVKMLANDMKMASYPVDLGKGEKLSALGQKLVGLLTAAGKTRSETKKDLTFRDVENPTVFRSLFDDTPSCKLPREWMQITFEKGNCKLNAI